jgi:hypothetical protein
MDNHGKQSKSRVGKMTKLKPRVGNIKMGLTTSGQNVINPSIYYIYFHKKFFDLKSFIFTFRKVSFCIQVLLVSPLQLITCLILFIFIVTYG